MKSKEELYKEVDILNAQIQELNKHILDLQEQLLICETASIFSSSPIKNKIFNRQKHQSLFIKENTILSLEQIIFKNINNLNKRDMYSFLEKNLQLEVPDFFDFIKSLNGDEMKDLLNLINSETAKENIKNWVAVYTYLFNLLIKEKPSS